MLLVLEYQGGSSKQRDRHDANHSSAGLSVPIISLLPLSRVSWVPIRTSSVLCSRTRSVQNRIMRYLS